MGDCVDHYEASRLAEEAALHVRYSLENQVDDLKRELQETNRRISELRHDFSTFAEHTLERVSK